MIRPSTESNFNLKYNKALNIGELTNKARTQHSMLQCIKQYTQDKTAKIPESGV